MSFRILSAWIVLLCALNAGAARQIVAKSSAVTIAASGEPVSSILERLSGNAGIQLSASEEVGWERVTVIARNRLVEEVTAGIATLLHYTWSEPSGSLPPGAERLAAGLKVRQREAELYRLTLERGAADLFRLPEYLKIPEEKAAALLKRVWN